MMNILIVGGNRGVGLMLTKEIISKGWRAAVIAKEKNTYFKKSNNLLYKSIDLNNINETSVFLDKVINKWGKLDGVVFYAGITPFSSIIDCSEELYDSIFNVNLKSTFFITQKILKNMMNKSGGSIVFFGTSQMDSGEIDRAPYAISKGSLKVLSEHLAKRYSKYNIRSNMVIMGWTNTEGEINLRSSLGMNETELLNQAAKKIPMGRMLNVNDPVPAVMYFLSEDSKMVTGSIIRVTGGEYI